jgi:hypothetical protein
MAYSKARQAIDEIPSQVKRIARSGFHNAARLPSEVLEDFLGYYARSIPEGAATIDLEKLAEYTKTDVSQARSILMAMSVIVSTLGLEKTSADEFLTEGRGVLFDDEDVPAVKFFVEHISRNSSAWKQNIEHRSLANRTLPALTDFEISVDLRLRFKSQEIEDAVAVALVYVDTDADNQSLWFQMTRGDVRGLIDKLTNTLQQMDAAEKLNPKLGGR